MTEHEDAQMFARLRTLWSEVDPMPAGLIDRMAEGLPPVKR